MNLIQRHIQYLVTTTDCVILPGWGGLIAVHTPAEVTENSCFIAPRRLVVFNPSLCHDDGRLAMSVSRRQHIPYEKARAEIAAEVDAMRAEYEATGMVTIPRIGSWRRSQEGSMIFTAHPGGVAAARYAYLPALPLPYAATESQTEEEVPDVNIMRYRRDGLGWKILRYAALLAILLGLTLTLSTPINVSFHDRPDFASLGAQPSFNTSVEETEETDYPPLVIALPDSALAVAPVAAKVASETPQEPRCYLIIGSFPSLTAAEQWITKRPETGLEIIEHKGKYRVYAATGQTVEEAMALKADKEFAKRHPDAWVYCRRSR